MHEARIENKSKFLATKEGKIYQTINNIRQEVNFFVVLKSLIIRKFRVIFIQSFTLDARIAFC